MYLGETNNVDPNNGDVPVFDPNNVNISFNGCGFLGIYHVGVAAALRAYLPNMRFSVVCGASAGALAGASLLGNVSCDDIAHELMLAGSECRKLLGGPINPRFNVCGRLEDALMRLLPEDIHKRANGKLFVSVTSVYTGENIIISNYTSKKELVESVIASTFIPIFSGIFPSRVRGVPVIDGGFSVNQVVLNENTITVSPFAGDAHICPQDDIVEKDMMVRLYVAQAGTNISWENMRRLTQVLYPPKTKVMSDLMMQGFLDTTRFLSEYGVIDRPLSCLTVESHLQQTPVKNASEGASLPETLTQVVKTFLEGETSEHCNDNLVQGQTQIPDADAQQNNSMTLTGKVYAIVKGLLYYQWLPLRLSVRAATFTIKALIASLAQILPLLTGDNNKYIKFKVERFLGVLIGYFGPIIGYEYKVIERPGCLKNRFGPQVNVTLQPDSVHAAAAHINKRQTKFNCDVHIHQFAKSDRESANAKRRASLFQRRKSVSVDRLAHHPAAAAAPPSTSPASSGGGWASGMAARRRFSIAPGLEGSMMRSAGYGGAVGTTPPTSMYSRSRHSDHEDSDEESEYGSESGSSQGQGQAPHEEDESEILSLQLESYVDAPTDMHMPQSTLEAIRLQSDNLEVAYSSRNTSARVSRRGTPMGTPLIRSAIHTPTSSRSRHGSGNDHSLMGAAAYNSAAAAMSATGTGEGPASETLQNIVRMTRDKDSMFKTYFTDENGELVTVSMYEVDDPVSLIGNDVLTATEDYGDMEADEEDGLDQENAAERLDRLHQIHQLYGDLNAR